ncbi:formate dehydrogenase (NAD+) [Hypoxylon texense]
MAPQKPRCTFKECRSAAQRIVGDCGFCDGHFCAKHRLLEDHKCSGLEDVSTSPTRSSPSPSSPPPTPSSGAAEFDDDSAYQWWLVGLGEYLRDSGCLDDESHERNAAQLEAERTQVIRGV